MGRSQDRKPAALVLLGLAVFVVVLAVVPGAVAALDALGQFVARPVISLLLGRAALGHIRRRARRPPDP